MPDCQTVKEVPLATLRDCQLNTDQSSDQAQVQLLTQVVVTLMNFPIPKENIINLETTHGIIKKGSSSS